MGQAKDMMPVSTDGPSCYPMYRTQVDSSLSKNQEPISLTTNDVTIKSCEQGFITKECIAIHNNYIFKPGTCIRPRTPGFLKLHVGMCVCVSSPPRALITTGVIWCDIGHVQLVKQF